MAEAVAGAVIVEQIASTGIEAGATVAIARPTQPLRGHLSQIATSATNDEQRALARYNHTVTTIEGKAYIFGGQTHDGQLCSTDVLGITLPAKDGVASEYAIYPALSMKDVETGETIAPAPRAEHAACARGQFLIIHGGRDASGNPIDEGCIWLWDSNNLSWSRVRAPSQIGKKLAPRFGHHIFLDEKQEILILHGGRTAPREPRSLETWMYTFDTLAWTELPSSPASASAAAFVDNVLYTISNGISTPGAIHFLDVKDNEADREKSNALEWHAVEFPANPLAPGPQPREGGALVPVTTGAGRQYLVYMFGHVDYASYGGRDFYSDIWSLQLPSRGFSAAALKDEIREKLPGVESGALSWAEMEILPADEIKADGKAHPGLRGFFGADAAGDKSVVFWGGLDGRGNEGDGWLLQIL